MAALQVEWKRFAVSIARVVELGDVVVVDYDIEQEMTAPPDWHPTLPRTRAGRQQTCGSRSLGGGA
jgi:hypothetical protein